MSIKRKPAVNMYSWESTFPTNQNSEQDRLKFLARMAYISVSHYLLYRNLVLIGAYKRRRIDKDMVLYTFNTEKRWGSKLSKMLGGIKEAIENKYLETAYIMINENKDNPKEATEVFTIHFCYNKEHAFSVLGEDGQPLITMYYKDEETFRNDAKHLVLKLNEVTKKLKPLKPNAFPEMKLTYYPHTPEEYQPTAFKFCSYGYTFANKPAFYHIGHISTNETALAISLKSTYFTTEESYDLEDVLFEDVTNDITTRSEMVPESPLAIQQNPEEKVTNAEVAMENEEVEMHRDDGHMIELRASASPHPNELSPNIHPDETIDEEQATPPYRRRPLKRKVTPRSIPYLRNVRLFTPKKSVSTSKVPVSPNDDVDNYQGEQ